MRTLSVVLTLTVAPVLAVAQTFTLDQVMSAPFPSGMVSAPTGTRVAWIQNDEGERNIWVAEGPDFRGRQLTAYTGDDGQELGSLVFTPNGWRLVFVRGGAPNRQGEIPNPALFPDPAERAIWSIPFDGGDPKKLAEASGPAMSPQGDVVAYSLSQAVWTVPVDGSDEPTRQFSVRGRAASLRWSPDGSKIAFISNRGDHAFLGVFDKASRTIVYVDPSIDRDAYPAWSPDGSKIAFVRLSRRAGGLPFSPVRSAPPWSIRIADVATQSSIEIWRAEPGVGSAFHGIVASNPIFWGVDDRVVFPWERDGWVHLYSLPARGGTVTQLTQGAFEVEDVLLTADRTELVFSSNQDDIDRRHVWRVSVTGGPAKPVTTGTGIEWSPVVMGDGSAVAFLAAGATIPAHAEVVPNGRRTMADRRQWLARETMPDDFPSDRLVEPEQVIFSAADGMRIHGQLFLPLDLRDGERRPAVIFFHGGSRRQMLLGFHYRGYYHNAYALNQYLANKGYVVLAVNYRSGTGYGMEFREALNYGATGGSEFNDVMGAGLYLQNRPDVDPDRIGLWGGSYGGYLTAMGLARSSDLFAAGVDIHGVHDWNVGINNFRPDYDVKDYPEFARTAFESSPMADVDTWRSPVLVIHGDDDRNVKFAETVTLVEALRERSVEVEQLIFPDEVHGFLMHRSWMAAYRAAADFFDRKLRSSAPLTP